MKKLYLFLFASLIIFTSCEYGETFTFVVSNESSKTIEVKTSLFEQGFHSSDTIHVIKNGESKEIAREYGGISGYREHPKSIYQDGDVIPNPEYKFDIYIDDILVPELKLYSHWTYNSKKHYEGTYELVITNELLKTTMSIE